MTASGAAARWPTPAALSCAAGIERTGRQLREALPTDQPADATAEFDHGDIDRIRGRMVLISGLDLVVLTVVVWAMVAKPGI